MRQPAAHRAHMAADRLLVFFFFHSPEFTPPFGQNKSSYPCDGASFLPQHLVKKKKIKKNNNAASHNHHRRQARTRRLVNLDHVTRNWLQFRPIVLHFSLPGSPYAISPIYTIIISSPHLRHCGRETLVGVFIIYLFSTKPCRAVCVCMPECTCAYVFCFFFYFGVGIVLGSWRLRLKSVGESYEF